MKKEIEKLVDIGLNYGDIDYIYILEEIKRVLNGKKIDINEINPEDYM